MREKAGNPNDILTEEEKNFIQRINDLAQKTQIRVQIEDNRYYLEEIYIFDDEIVVVIRY